MTHFFCKLVEITRNQTLFRYVFRSRYRVRSALVQNCCEGRGSCVNVVSIHEFTQRNEPRP